MIQIYMNIEYKNRGNFFLGHPLGKALLSHRYVTRALTGTNEFNISSFPLQVQSLKLLSTLTWRQRSWNGAWCKELPFRWLSKVIGGSILGWEILSDFCPQGSPIDYGRAPMGRLCVCDAIISNDILSVLCLQPLFKTFTSNNPTWML